MKTFFAFILTTLSLLAATSASAQTPFALYWDPTASTGATLGGSGTWDLNGVTPTWYDGTQDVIWNSSTNANNSDAWFEGTAGTVTVASGDALAAADIFFTNVTGIYTITNTTGAETLTVTNVDTGTNEAIMGVKLVNSTVLTKNGTGRLHLPVGNGLNNVQINQGYVAMELVNTAIGSSATVANGAALEVNGGTNNTLNGINGVDNVLTVSGTGVANDGAIRNILGDNTWLETINLAGNTEIYVNTNSAFLYDGSDTPGPMTDNGQGYNLTIAGTFGNVQFVKEGLTIGGRLIIQPGASCFMYVSGTMAMSYTNSLVGAGSELFAQADNGLGSIPSALMTTNTLLDGGTLDGYGTWTQNANRGITVTTNGGTIEDTDTAGTWTTAGVYSPNTPVTFASSGGTIQIANTALLPFNLGSGSLTLNGGNIKLQTSDTDVYSNLVINGCTFTFNYDPTNLGVVPSAFCPSNLWFNGGQFHVGHSGTIAANRGIYVTSAGITVNEVTANGTVTMNSSISGPGAITFASNKYILGANNTYGGSTINSSTIVFVGNGGGTGTLGTGNTSDGGGLQFNRTGSYTYNGIISGAGTVSNVVNGIITLNGNNTYSGLTKLNTGTLILNGNNTGTGTLTVNSGAALGGTGTISAPVTVASGGKLELGSSPLTINNSLTLSGSATVLVNPSGTPTSGEAVVSGTLTGPTTLALAVTNIGPALTAGETFTVFNKALSGTTTINVTGGGAGVTWTASPSAGTITVASVPPPPQPAINSVQLMNGNFIFSGTNGESGTNFIVLTTTNLLLPINQWNPIATNPFLSNGGFFFTNTFNAGNPQLFYLLQIQ